MNVVLLGPASAGKSSIVNGLAEGWPAAICRGRGTTTSAAYPLQGSSLRLVDTPGLELGALAKLLAELEAVLSGAKFGPASGVALCLPCSSVRLKVDMQILQVLLSMGLGDAEHQVILVGTKADRADAEERGYFVDTLAPVFFQGLGHAGATVVVSNKDFSPLWRAIQDLPPRKIRFQVEGSLGSAIAKLIGHDEGTFAKELRRARRHVQLSLALVNGPGLSREVQAAAQAVPCPAQAPQQSFGQQLQDGQGQRMDALILQGVDGNALSSLIPAPLAISNIGLLMCLATARDFSLEPSSRLKHPGSFRLTLLQLAHDTHAAFMEAHGNMHQLGFLMDAVPTYLQATVAHLLSGTDVVPRVSEELEKVSSLGERCAQLAEGTHCKFQGVLQLLWEIQELLVSKRGASEKELEELKMARQRVEKRLQSAEASKKELQEEFECLSRIADEANQDLQKVMSQRPSVDDLVGAAFADAFGAVLRGLSVAISKLWLLCSGNNDAGGASAESNAGAKGAGEGETETEDEPAGRRAARANARVAPLAEQLLACAAAGRAALSASGLSAADRRATAAQLQTVQGTLARISVEAEMQSKHSGLARDMASISCDLASLLAKAEAAVRDGESKLCAKSLQHLLGLEPHLLGLKARAASVSQAGVLPPPQLTQGQGQSSGAMQGMADCWEFQMKMAKELLIQAEERRLAEFDELQELNAKMLEENLKLSRIDLSKLREEEILRIVRAAIEHMCRCKVAWARVVQLFMYISELTKFCSKKQLKDFDRLAAAVAVDCSEGDCFVQSLKDQMYQTVVRSSQSCFAAAELSRAYHRISSRHFLEPLRCLGRTLQEPGDKVQQELMAQCGRATAAIEAAIREQRDAARARVQERVARIEAAVQELQQPLQGELRKESEPELGPKIDRIVEEAIQTVGSCPEYAALPAVDTIDFDEGDLI